MGKREISIVIKAKNELLVGLSSAKKSIEDFGESAMRIGKFFVTAFLTAGTAIAGFAAKAISSFSEAQAAENSVRSAFRAFGEEVDVNTAKVNKLADAIENETGISDEKTKQIVAQLKMLGVQTEQLESAAKATIALTAAGMSEEAATRAVFLAREGNFDALAKYIPALRLATTEEEKALIVQDFLARSYETQKEKLGTVQGQWELLKEKVGDVWIEVGSAIANNEAFSQSLASVSEMVVQFGEKIKAWVSDGGVENFRALFLMTMEEISYRIQTTGLHAKAFFEVFKDLGPIEYMGNVIGSFVNKTIEELSFLKDFAVAVWEKIKNPFSDWKGPDFSMVYEANKDFLKSLAGLNNEYQTDVEKTLTAIDELRIAHNQRILDISNQQLEGLARNNAKQVENERINAAASVQIAEQKAAAIVNANKKATDASSIQADEKKAKETSVINELQIINQDAAEKINEIWRNSAAEFAAIEAQKVTIAQNSASQIASASAGATSSSAGASGTVLSGGSFESSREEALAIRRLQASGVMPPSGTVLAPGQSEQIQRAILAELTTIRTQNNQLLTFS